MMKFEFEPDGILCLPENNKDIKKINDTFSHLRIIPIWVWIDNFSSGKRLKRKLYDINEIKAKQSELILMGVDPFQLKVWLANHQK